MKEELVKTLIEERSITIPSPYRYLGEVWSDLPDNVYLNKTITGCGGTTVCLSNNIPYIILMPFVATVRNKIEQHSEALGVFSGVSSNDINTYLLECNTNNITPKIVGTYDSILKILPCLSEGQLNTFKLCIDEAHNLISLGAFKANIISCLLNNFRKFSKWVFITATPNDPTLLPNEIQDVEFVRLHWECSEIINMTTQQLNKVSDCNKHVIEICKQHLLGEVEGNAYIFYNSVNEIISVIKKLKHNHLFTPENVNIFCADNHYNGNNIKYQLGVKYIATSFGENKKINFLTATAFEGCDIYDEDGVTYIIVSNKRDSTKTSAHILVPQICGRLRNSKYKSEVKMLIAGFSQFENSSKKKFLEHLDISVKNAKYTIKQAKQSKEDGMMLSYQTHINSSLNNPFLYYDEDSGELVFNQYGEKSELQAFGAYYRDYYTTTLDNGDSALDKHQLISRKEDSDMVVVSDMSKLLVDVRFDYSRVMRQYIKAIESGDTKLVEAIEMKSEIHKHHLEVVGASKIKALYFHKTKVTRAFELALKSSLESVSISSSLNFKIGGRYTTEDVVKQLSIAYNKCGLDTKAKGVDIKNYFNVKDVYVMCKEDGKRKRGYEIVGVV